MWQAAASRLRRRDFMTSLLILAILYLLAALALILVIDRSVGIMFPASADDAHAAARPSLPDVSN
ncbi:hypothetical protein CCGE525_30000 (plasmid) [Rhizobium jaguaris]|uniref:Uncharacterized protein n=2 Tax=Rhizobium jaguaris TaxID=1312183 RepID=A0A387G4S6_9HYPH|nr:hypothetical protein CCGE525_30000 [Rhizobium jaguaris]